MLNRNWVGVDTVLDTTLRDNKFLAEHIDYNDVLEWIGDVIRLIGAPGGLDEVKVTGNSMITPNITVDDGRGSLPVDYIEVRPGGVRDYDTKEVFRGATDKFIAARYITGDTPLNQQVDKTYHINDNYIFTSVDECTIEMTYRAFKIDEQGLPMIPDNIKFLKAAAWYIAERIAYNLYMTDKLTERKYEKINQNRMYYIGAASSSARVPSADLLESWTNMRVRLNPMISHLASSYKYSGNREDLNV